MTDIWYLKDKQSKNDDISFLLGEKGDQIIHLDIKEDIVENYIHQYMEESIVECNVVSGETLARAISKRGALFRGLEPLKMYLFVRTQIKPGQYFPRIYRPSMTKSATLTLNNDDEIMKINIEVFQYKLFFPNDKTTILSSLNQLATLKELLLAIFSTIHPTNTNLKSYGHNIKNLLILSCIEVESQLKGIYKANEHNSKTHYTTKDYFKLKKLMQLDKYVIRFSYYPELKPINPFLNWDVSNPTKSLKWYDGYNAVKHNSEAEFNKATLESAMTAICAVAILIKAQYGDYVPYWKEKIGNFFEITNKAKWKLEDRILPPFKGQKWIPKKIGL